MSFLKAEWRKLVMINYSVNPEILQSYVPKGTSLDFFDGKCYVSVVGFMFLNTKLLGIKVPFHVNFEEVNLRFYVKREHEGETKRGVVFIKEIVPKSAITFVANTIYNEHYETLPMQHHWNITKEKINVEYKWKKQKKWNRIAVEASTKQQEILPGSEIEFIAEHYWGYSEKNVRETTEYEVKHPSWQFYPVHKTEVELDFKTNYGDDFEFLKDKKPTSVFLLEGSEVSVEGKKSL
ncbi:YqjF family protein [Tenacibaculum sp. ZS6-P6]|uniref:YqjF family protein n=1 Tax=Tenacibaculum sp. ZS6-P6 TaxID=3447503 RepID=UPI003F94378E